MGICARLQLVPENTKVILRSPHHAAATKQDGPVRLFDLPSLIGRSVCRRALSLVTQSDMQAKRFLREGRVRLVQHKVGWIIVVNLPGESWLPLPTTRKLNMWIYGTVGLLTLGGISILTAKKYLKTKKLQPDEETKEKEIKKLQVPAPKTKGINIALLSEYKHEIWKRPAANFAITNSSFFDLWKAKVIANLAMFPDNISQTEHPNRVSVHSLDAAMVVEAAIHSGPAISACGLSLLDAVIASAKNGAFRKLADPLMQEVGNFYATWSREKLVTRLMRSRVMTYYMPQNVWCDKRLMPTGGVGITSYRIAIKDRLEEFLLPEEGPLAAFMPLRSLTQVFNDGGKTNHAVITSDDSHVKQAWVYGLVGARLEVDTNDPKSRSDYGILGTPPKSPIEKAVSNVISAYADKLKLPNDESSVTSVSYRMYVARSYMINMDMFDDLNSARFKDKKMCLRLMGHGLGAWGSNYLHSRDAYYEGLAFAMRDGLPKDGRVVSVEMMFQNVPTKKAVVVMVRSAHPNVDWGLHINMFCPLEKKSLELVVSFSFDGMSTQGNEFWVGSLAGSMDPATICATAIAYTTVGFIMPGVFLPENKFPETPADKAYRERMTSMVG